MTPEMIKRIEVALNIVWDGIGGDVLRVAEEMSGSSEIPRDEVVEVCLDADYAESYGDDTEAIEELRKLSYGDQMKIAQGAFPFEFYGW